MNVSAKIKQVVESNETIGGKIFDIVIQTLIIISLISVTVETLPNLDKTTQQILKIIEVVSIIVFSIEYVLRIIVADKKTAYIFSFYGIIDLLAILPFYLTSTIDLRSIRIFRLLRLFRALKLIRFSKAMKNFKEAFISIKEELILFTIITLFLLYVSAVGIYYFEHDAQPENFASIVHSFWWAIATLTTVGYGDVYPITTGGKIFTSFVVLIGIGIVAVPTGLISSALTQVYNEQKNNKEN